jgi:hypothetical protein
LNWCIQIQKRQNTDILYGFQGLVLQIKNSLKHTISYNFLHRI